MKTYFISERTGEKIYAKLNNSLSWGTTRNEDLIPTFLDALRDTAFYAQTIVDHVIPSYALDENKVEWWESETAANFLSELFDELDYHAPEGYYFGANEGDGSDFGFWKSED